MNYPSWDLPILGGGVLIGLVAILHVFVAHFAVGGGLFLVWTERVARRTGDAALLGYLRGHSRFFILIVLVLGAVSGVGIWWTIGLVHPPATSLLLHTFLWAWAIEWVLFAVEIAAAFVYYYGWDRLDARTHLTVGWVYFATAWLSLFVINGILTFMLTPGRWLESGSLLDAFFNPTMWPSLIVRSASAAALAGLYALLSGSVLADAALRRRVVRYAAKWVLGGIAVIPTGGLWYIAALPPLAREISMGGAPAVTIFAGLSLVLSAAVAAVTYLGPYRRPGDANVLVCAMLAVLGLAVTGVTEWVREAVRKPFIIYGYMYSNGLRVADRAALDREGVLASAKWASWRDAAADPLRAGYELYRLECRSCHTIDGYNGLRMLARGWREDFIDYQLAHLDELKGFMPPFVGSPAERQALARWLHAVGRGRPFAGVPGSGPGPEPASAGPVVPAADPAGLPAPAWLLDVLLVLTFLLHVLPMNVLLGGSVLLAWSCWKARGGPASAGGPGAEAAVGAHLVSVLPIATAATITLGIAPLLFLQVLYGPLFFTSSVLMAWPWLAVVALLLVAYYGFYGLALGESASLPQRAPLALACAALVLAIAFLFSHNVHLMQQPDTWAAAYAQSEHGFNLELGKGGPWARYLHFLIGSLAVAGLFVALAGGAGEAGAGCRHLGVRVFTVATLAQLASGVWFLASLPDRARRAFLGGSPVDTAVLLVAIALALGAVAVLRRRPWLAAGHVLGTLAGMAIARHRVRSLAVEPYFRLDELAARPQLGAAVLFAVLAVVGVLTLVWLIRRFALSGMQHEGPKR